MSNPNRRQMSNPNRLQPPKKSKTGIALAGVALVAMGGVIGVAYSEANKAERIHAEESARKTPPKTTSRTTTTAPTTTTVPTIETTQPTISTIPETTIPQGKDIVDPRDEKLRQRAALFSGCSVNGIYDGGSSIKLEISTSINADSFYAREAARKSDGGIYGSGVAIYQTDKNGTILNQTPVVRTDIAPGGKDHDAEHPTVTLPEREGAHYEVSAITGAAIGDKALVNAVACDVISFQNGQWNLAGVPAQGGSRTIG